MNKVGFAKATVPPTSFVPCIPWLFETRNEFEMNSDRNPFVFIATNCTRLTRNFWLGYQRRPHLPCKTSQGTRPFGQGPGIQIFFSWKVSQVQLNNLCLVVSGFSQPCQPRCVCATASMSKMNSSPPFPVFYSSSLCTGYSVAEAVYFAPRNFLKFEEIELQVSLKRHLSFSIEN